MKYEVILQDNKKIVMTKAEADILTKELFNTAKDRQEAFKLGENVFKRSAIKGIFPIQEEVHDNKEVWMEINREWDATCLKMSRYPLEQKIETEFVNRIFPGLKLNKIVLSDEEIAKMELYIRGFFKENPKYPRCPMRIWWPIISEKVAPTNPKTKKRHTNFLRMNKWWQYISRDDEAIGEWLQYH